MIYKILVHWLGFEYVTDFEDMKLLRKHKTTSPIGVQVWVPEPRDRGYR